MSKAEDLAEKAYPKGDIYIFGDASIACQVAYVKGYHQAEKDLELSWEDMMLIHRCIKDAMNYHLYKMMESVEGQKVVYQEVLKRYKEKKREEV